MLCSRVGHAKTKAHHPTIPYMDSSHNRPVEVFVWEAHLKQKFVKMVDPIGKIRFEVCD